MLEKKSFWENRGVTIETFTEIARFSSLINDDEKIIFVLMFFINEIVCDWRWLKFNLFVILPSIQRPPPLPLLSVYRILLQFNVSRLIYVPWSLAMDDFLYYITTTILSLNQAVLERWRAEFMGCKFIDTFILIFSFHDSTSWTIIYNLSKCCSCRET